MTNEEKRELLEHKNFIAQMDERKRKLRALLEDFEHRLQHYFTKPRTETNYQAYFESLEERNQVLALLAELSSCSFAVSPAPTFEDFCEMSYQRFDYEQEFSFAGF